MNKKIEILNTWIKDADNKSIVFFGGAGVSTESGIPDFRSADGLYNQKYKYPPEMIISHSFFMNNTSEFFEFYFDRMIPDSTILPNDCHKKLAELEECGKLSCVITQNIDGLHQSAGSKNVLELHGSIHRNYCMNCNSFYDLGQTKELYKKSVDNIATCSKQSCNGIVKPDVVLYEEPLDNKITTDALRHIASAQILIVAGTSLSVYPAAGFLDYFKGQHLVIINRDPTPKDKLADMCISANVGEVFKQISC